MRFLFLIFILFLCPINYVLAQSSNPTPLMIAAEKGSVDEVKMLIASGVKIDEQDKFGQTALFYAARRTKDVSYEVIKELLKNKANPNHISKEGYTALMVLEDATYSGENNCSFRSFDLLVENGADLNARIGTTSIVGSLIQDTCFRKNATLIRKETNFNSNERVIDGYKLQTTLAHLVVKLMPLNMIQLAFKYGMNPKTIDLNGKTLLFFAAYNDQYKSVMDHFINLGIDINVLDSSGFPALGHLLNRHNCKPDVLEYAQYLINQKGANPAYGTDNNNNTLFASNCFQRLINDKENNYNAFLFMQEMHQKGATLETLFAVDVILRSDYLPAIEYMLNNIHPRVQLGSKKVEPICILTGAMSDRHISDNTYDIALNSLFMNGIELNIPCEPLAKLTRNNDKFWNLVERGASIPYLGKIENWYMYIRGNYFESYSVQKIDIDFLQTLANKGLSNNILVTIVENITKKFSSDEYSSQFKYIFKSIVSLPLSYDHLDVAVLERLTGYALDYWRDSVNITRSNREKSEFKAKMYFFQDLIKVVLKRNPSETAKKNACWLFWNIDINEYDISRADKRNFNNLHFLACGY